MKILGVTIFATGRHNGRDFSGADLDSIVAAHNALKMPVVLKFGHGEEGEQPFTDGMPALGWATNVRREADNLVADFDHVPEIVIKAFKAGQYRFTSVELLKDVEADGKQWPWVLDAVALLGAERPAVKTVSDLQALVAKREAMAIKFAHRLTFSAQSEADALKAENTRLVRELTASTLELAVSSGRILPRDREHFKRQFGDRGTVADAVKFINDSPRPDPALQTHQGGARVTHTEQDPAGERPDDELTRKAYELMEERRKEGRPLSFFEAGKIIMKRDPELGRRYIFMPGTK